MTGDINIGKFGDLTWKWENIKAADTNNDNVINENEFNAFLNKHDVTEEQKKSFEFETISKLFSNNNTIDKNDVDFQEQLIKMQELVENLINNKVSKEFIGKAADKQETVKSELRNFIKEFSESYKSNPENRISDMAKKFEPELNKKYNKLKAEYNSSKEQSAVLEKFVTQVDSAYRDAYAQQLKPIIANFIANVYDGTEGLETALTKYLNEYLGKSDSKNIESVKTDWNNAKKEFGSYIDEDEFAELKDKAKEVLGKVIDLKIKIKFNGKDLSATNLKQLVDSFGPSHANDLIAAVDEALSSVSTVSKKDDITKGIEDEKAKADNEFKKILSQAASTVLESYISSKNLNSLINSEQYIKLFSDELNKAAKEYGAAHPNANQKEVETYLRSYMNEVPASKIEDELSTWDATAARFKSSSYVDEYGFEQIKADAKALILAMVDAGIEIKVGNQPYKITGENGANAFIKQYSTPAELLAAMKQLRLNINTTQTRADIMMKDAVHSDDFKIDLGSINYTNIDGYMSNTKYSTNGVDGKDAVKKRLHEQYRETIDNNLKEQLKKQIETMLSSKGMSFDDFASVFENIYNSTLNETLDEAGEPDKTNKAWLHKRQNWVLDKGVKDIVDTFLEKFNENISSALENMFASSKDFDIIDLDFSQLDTTEDENGNSLGAITDDDGNDVKGLDEGETLADAYAKGKVLTIERCGAEYYFDIASKMIDGLRSQMQAKAEKMCLANGIKFDQSAFNTMFNDAKSLAVASSVLGYDAKSGNIVGALATTGSMMLVGSAVGSAAGPIGTIVGAAAGLFAGIVTSIFKFHGQHSKSSLDVRTLIDTFTENFKQKYTEWVEGQDNSNI